MDLTNVQLNPRFSDFPFDVLKWMKNNCDNLRLSLKLMQICKYFRVPTSSFPLQRIGSYSGRQIWYQTLNHRWEVVNAEDLPKNLWITEEFWIYSIEITVSDIIPKIGFCETKGLGFKDQTIFFEEYKILTAGKRVESLRLENVSLKHTNGDDILFEDFLKFIPRIKKIHFKKIVTKIKSLQAAKNATSSSLSSIEINDFPKNSEIHNFLLYLEIHPSIYFKINHQENHKTAELQAFVDKIIIQKGVTKYQPPEICFLHQTSVSQKRLSELRQHYFRDSVSSLRRRRNRGI